MTKYHPILNFILNILYLNQKIAKTISTKEHIFNKSGPSNSYNDSTHSILNQNLNKERIN